MKTSSEQFYDDALKGGYTLALVSGPRSDKTYNLQDIIFRMLLDPLAWQAVGRTRGWGFECACGCGKSEDKETSPLAGYKINKCVWKENMNNLMPALQDGSIIELYLKTLEK